MNNEEKQKTIKNILLSETTEKTISENEEVLFELLPELRYEKGFEQKSVWHCYDVWDHTLHAVLHSKPDFDIRFILLLHDIGKPFSCQEDGNVRHFRGHAQKSAEIAKVVLNRLGYPPETVEDYCFFIRNHATTITEEILNKDNTDKYKKLLYIQFCDGSAYAPEYAKQIEEKLRATESLFEKFDK